MKRLIFMVVIASFALSACISAGVQLPPPGTLAAQTLAAMPKPPTLTPIPPTVAPTDTPQVGPPTPALDLTITGAYCLPTTTRREQGLVTKVIDGATIEVALNFQTVIVRYIGVASPRIPAPSEWQAAQAAGFNANMVSGKVVTLVQDAVDVDSDGALLRYVLVDRSFANYEVVRNGFGKAVSTPPNVACENALIAAQVEAQTAIVGVWIPTPVPTFTSAPSATITNTGLPPTETNAPPCTCNSSLSCNKFNTQRQAQACYNYCLQSQGVQVLPDQNRNGRVCEGLP
jgi:endonuclease YncB( thermonuclease family)